MCGIAGFNLTSADLTLIRPSNLAKHLAMSIEHRGKDATGMSWFDPDGKVWYTKRPTTATKFVAAGLHQNVERGAATAIIHTRAATQGSPSCEDNNHPIVIDRIVGVHNGIIWNDNALFRKHADKFTRNAEVDSEIIFQMIEAYGFDSLENLEGDAAISWIDCDETDVLNVAALGGRPLHIAETVNGSFVFASEAECLRWSLGKFTGVKIATISEVPAGTRLRVRDGKIVDWDNLAPIISTYRLGSSSNYGYKSTTIVDPAPKGSTGRGAASDPEMVLAIQNLFNIEPDDGIAFDDAVKWVEENVDDISVLIDESLDYDEFADFNDEFEQDLANYDDRQYDQWVFGDYPVGDKSLQEKFNEAMSRVIAAETAAATD